MKNTLLTIVVVALLLAAGKLHGEAYDLVADPADPLPAARAAFTSPPPGGLALSPACKPAAFSPQQAAGFFYEELAPYGEWISTRAFGWAWYPRGVARRLAVPMPTAAGPCPTTAGPG